jgi:ACS family tartrate transporter-like MFS transporter
MEEGVPAIDVASRTRLRIMYPGIIVYLTHWFRYQDRAKAVALFMTAVPLSNFLGAPVSGLLLGANWLGLAGWRWLFIIEGAPSIILGVITIFYLTDWPHQAKWLAKDEREWIAGELRKEKDLTSSGHAFRILEAFRNREVVLLALAYFFIVTGLYGFNIWLPTMVKAMSGLPNLTVTVVSALPYFVAFAALLLVGWSSDRTSERKWHSAVPMFVAGAGLLLSAITQSNLPPAMAMFCIAAAGLYSFFPAFWALPTTFLAGSAAAASIGLINSIGNLGGFVGPYVVGYINNKTNSFFGGMTYLSCSAIAAGGLMLTLRKTNQSSGG